MKLWDWLFMKKAVSLHVEIQPISEQIRDSQITLF